MMKQLWTILLAVCWLVVGYAPLPAQASESPCCMWQACSDTATVYIVGAIHIGNQSVYPLPRQMEMAFARSDVLAVEAADTSNMLKQAVYPEGEKLQTELSPEQYEKVRAYLAYFGEDISRFNHLRPWYLALMLHERNYQMAGYRYETGIDTHFIRKAVYRKAIFEFEPGPVHTNVLSGMDSTAQIKMLMDSLVSGEVAKSSERQGIQQLYLAWRTGDVQQLEKFAGLSTVPDTDAGREEYRRFIVDRNVNMVNQIVKFLSGNRTIFVVVGAAHVVGPDGIVMLLREQGYQVDQL